MNTFLRVMALMLSAQICSAESLVGTWRCDLTASTDPDYVSSSETATYLADGSFYGQVHVEFRTWGAPIEMSADMAGTWVSENSALTLSTTSIDISRLLLSGNDHTHTTLAESLESKITDLFAPPSTVTFDGPDRLYMSGAADRQRCERLPARDIS